MAAKTLPTSKTRLNTHRGDIVTVVTKQRGTHSGFVVGWGSKQLIINADLTGKPETNRRMTFVNVEIEQVLEGAAEAAPKPAEKKITATAKPARKGRAGLVAKKAAAEAKAAAAATPEPTEEKPQPAPAVEPAKATKRVKAANQPRVCPDCKIRKSLPISESEAGLCRPCLDYAEAENTHSDYAHAQIAEGKTEGLRFEGDGLAQEIEAMKSCPVCHPELDPRTEKRVTTGTSRKGMIVHAQGGAADKAKTFADAVATVGGTAKAEETKNLVTVVAEVKGSLFKAVWTVKGAWIYDESQYAKAQASGKPRKVRNLAELLRLVAEAGK